MPVRYYFGLRKGPGCPRTFWEVLASFRGGVRRWYSAYHTAHGVLEFPRYRLGPFKWGITPGLPASSPTCPARARSVTLMNDDTGFTSAPARYLHQGREKIDEIRDSMSDAEFVAFCRGTALKYEGRNKGPSDPEKLRFYQEMATHVANGGPDPRHKRSDFTSYTRARRPLTYPHPTHSVLDHGFVRLIETWGHGEARLAEAGIIEAARQSTQGNFRGWERDQRLLAYLYNNKHATPFEFAGMVVEVRAPIFIFRQWHRHRTQSYNEMSARYAQVPDLHYIPTRERVEILGRSTSAQSADQGESGAGTGVAFMERLAAQQETENQLYKLALDEGVPRELARLHHTVGRYTQMRASANLRNWLGFLTLRLDPHAQWEIRQYANAVLQVVSDHFPQTSNLFLAHS